ncbi:MAG: PhzF family phenazine biosynthesis protein [Microbacteriaceae bacterium]
MTSASPVIRRYSAFTDNPEGGNPAGVVLDATGLSVADMQSIAADVGYSETAFLTARADKHEEFDVAYFTPVAEVDFCGHATIASGVALAEAASAGGERDDTDDYGDATSRHYSFHTKAGVIAVDVLLTPVGYAATLTSPPTSVAQIDDAVMDEQLDALDWHWEDLDERFPPAVGWSGNWHPVLVAGSRTRLRRLDYDYDLLAELSQREGWTTIQLVFPDDNDSLMRTWYSRNPGPGVGIDEDPATGSAAVAFGAYLVSTGTAAPGDVFTILQGDDMGRPSVLLLTVGNGAMRVTGTAVEL